MQCLDRKTGCRMMKSNFVPPSHLHRYGRRAYIARIISSHSSPQSRFPPFFAASRVGPIVMDGGAAKSGSMEGLGNRFHHPGQCCVRYRRRRWALLCLPSIPLTSRSVRTSAVRTVSPVIFVHLLLPQLFPFLSLPSGPARPTSRCPRTGHSRLLPFVPTYEPRQSYHIIYSPSHSSTHAPASSAARPRSTLSFRSHAWSRKTAWIREAIQPCADAMRLAQL